MVIAVTAAMLLYRGMLTWFPLPRFFQGTAIFLMLFASGLVLHGIGEFQEAGILPTIVDHVWSTHRLLSEQGAAGKLLKGIFGYNESPSLLQVLGYLAYLLGCGTMWLRLSKR